MDKLTEIIKKNNLCVFHLASTCKNNCKGRNTHLDESSSTFKLLRLILGRVWLLDNFNTPLPKIIEMIHKLDEFKDIPDFKPFVRPCIFSFMSHCDCENWKSFRTVEIPISYEHKIVKLVVCYSKMNSKGGENRVVCGIHFDLEMKGNKVGKLLSTNLPTIQKDVCDNKTYVDESFVSLSSLPQSLPELVKVYSNTNENVWKDDYESLKKDFDELSNEFFELENEYKKLQKDCEYYRTKYMELKSIPPRPKIIPFQSHSSILRKSKDKHLIMEENLVNDDETSFEDEDDDHVWIRK